MDWKRTATELLTLLGLLAMSGGCSSMGMGPTTVAHPPVSHPAAESPPQRLPAIRASQSPGLSQVREHSAPLSNEAPIALVAHGAIPGSPGGVAAEAIWPESLDVLVATAQESNPRIRRLRQEAAAAWQRVPQVRALPDPMVGVNAFGRAMRMGDGFLRGSFMASQEIPWLKRLGAEGQQAAFEAWMFEQEWRGESLQVAAEVKASWYRLYLLSQQIQINEANQRLLDSLAEVAIGRVRVGEATQGDVLLATLELSRLQEELLMLRQQRQSATAMLNQLLNRPADTPIAMPDELAMPEAPWPLDTLRQLAFDNQPEINAARFRTQATAWGIQIAAMRRIPDLTLRYEWMFMDMDEDMGRGDPWQVGASVNVPLWHEKYGAMRREAGRRHLAAHAAVEEAIRQYDALLVDLLAQSRATRATIELYESTILPQARQTLESDQQAYGQGRVEFDRVVTDVRNLLTLQVNYHRALADYATVQARIEAAVGVDLSLGQGPPPHGEEELSLPPPRRLRGEAIPLPE